MATEILSIASAAATSSDFTCDGLTLVFLKANGNVPAGCQVDLKVKTSAGGYVYVATFDAQHPSGVPAAGTYQMVRIDTGEAVGAEKAA